MPWATAIRLLDARAQSDDDALTRIVATILFLAGATTAVGYAFFAQAGAGRVLYLATAAGFAALAAVCSSSRGRPGWITAAGLTAIAMISGLLAVPDPAATVPLFLLWPMVALAYFRRPLVLVGAVAFAAVVLVPTLVLGATIESRIVYLGALTTASIIGVLVGVMRRGQLQLQRRLEDASRTDPLTGLLNRRAFAPAMAEVVDRATRADEPLSLGVVILDLDHFKRYNDAHGHLEGDDALRRLSRILETAAGKDGLVCRHGGEEFVVLVPGGTTAGEAFAARVASDLAAEPVADALRLSVSCGIVDLEQGEAALQHRATIAPHFGEPTPTALTPPVLIALADDALYAAKHAGRARTARWADGRIAVGDPSAAPQPAPQFARPDTALRVAEVRGDDTPGLQAADSRSPSSRAGEPEPSLRRAASRRELARSLRDPRDVLIKKVAVAMFACGSLNCIAALALVDYTPFTHAWQVVITAVLILTTAVAAIVPSGPRMIQIASLWGVVIVAATVATVAPVLSAPLFSVWAVALGAYFGSRRFISVLVAWAGVWLGGALVLLPADAPKVVMWAGMMVNVALVALVIAVLRDHEARLHRRLEEAADVDPLTGLLNRRAFDVELGRALGSGEPLTVVMVDADHFKAYNDTFGHLAGDRALQTLAAALRDAARGTGFVCRFGGEEFAVALPRADVLAARAYVDAVSRGLPDRFGDAARAVTVSAGIAMAAGAEERIEAVLARADGALYLAKAGGRARAAWPSRDGAGIVVGGPSPTHPLDALGTAIRDGSPDRARA